MFYLIKSLLSDNISFKACCFKHPLQVLQKLGKSSVRFFDDVKMEKKAGISEYVSDHPPIQGVIKSRYFYLNYF